MSGSDVNSAIIQEFLSESFENLSSISEEITKLEQSQGDEDLLNSIYRKIHTLKGSASFLNYTKLQEVTHNTEYLLDMLREKQIDLNPDLVDILLKSTDCCNDILNNIADSGSEGSDDFSALVEDLKKLQAGETSSVTEELKGSERTVVDDIQENGDDLNTEALQDQQLNDNNISNIEDELAELLKVANSSNVNDESKSTPIEDATLKEKPSSEEVVAKEESVVEIPPKEVSKEAPKKVDKPSQGEKKAVGRLSDQVVKVNVKLLDKIMNVVGELVINRNQILQYSKVNEDVELNRFAHQLNVITTELQTDIMTTRMQPVGSVFTKFERTVRDLSRGQNKKVKLEISGSETELDKTLIEVIKDPLTHLVRNAVDHGLETPEERLAAGKSEQGKLFIKAYHEGGQVVIEMTDDGKGINKDRVLKKAIEKELITIEEAERMSSSKILNLIFRPGFSTAQKLTNISGRGVGMDVVKSNIERIGGRVDIQSKEGEGTTFKLKIPLTLAIVPALVVQSGDETFAIHQKNLMELVLLEEDEADSIEEIYGSEFFRRRGELIPIFRLNKVIGIESDNQDKNLNIVILQADGRIYGLIVDTILDTQEIVVKPFGRKLKDLKIYAGATIMGDGRVALILDVLGFFGQVDNSLHKNDKTEEAEVNISHDTLDRHEYLLCKLGDNRQYGIPLPFINRLEEFTADQVEWSGDQPLVRYLDMAMALIFPDLILYPSSESVFEGKTKEELKNIALPCVVLKIQGSLFGFCVKKIQDITVVEDNIETDSVESDKLFGTFYHGDKLVSILDVHAIVEALPIGKKILENSRGRNGKKVLLLEDSSVYRGLVEKMLLSEGFSVESVTNGEDGLGLIESGKEFDIILTDIEMPKMNGWDFTKAVRDKGEGFSKIPIVAITTRVSEQDLQRGRDVGLSAHLEKLDRQVVLETVQQLLAA